MLTLQKDKYIVRHVRRSHGEHHSESKKNIEVPKTFTRYIKIFENSVVLNKYNLTTAVLIPTTIDRTVLLVYTMYSINVVDFSCALRVFSKYSGFPPSLKSTHLRSTGRQ